MVAWSPHNCRDFNAEIRMNYRFVIRRWAILLAPFLLTASGNAVELTRPALNAFNRYVQLTEERIHAELTPAGPFLYLDQLPPQARDAEYNRIRQGEVSIHRLTTLDHGRKIDAPDALLHHWVGVIFIPGATLRQTLALVQDYSNHQKYYAPDVERSQLLKHNGNDFQVFYRLKRHKVITVVLNTNYDVHYETLSPNRSYSRSYSTRIAEVADPGEKGEHEKPVDDGNGFMWRLYSYWRFEQRDGGTYVQCEAISLSRDIPTGLGWMIGPFVESVPRDSLEFTLKKTGAALTNK